LIRKNDFENLKNFINYYNIDLDSEILNFENVPFEIKYIELSQKLNSGVDISYELENYLSELKEKELNFIYLKALVIKFDVLILKKQYKEIIEIFENLKKIDDMICLSLKAKFYNSYLNALSLEEEFEKGFTILRKIKRIYKKLTKKEKLNMERFISVFYYNYGNYKKAYDFSKNHPLLRILCLYQMGEYLKIINSDYNILGFEKFLYIYAISLSFLLMGEIVSKDISNLKNSPKDKLIKYYFKGRINKAVEIAERYGIKTILNLLILFHPKNYMKLKKYKQIEKFLKFSKN